VELAILISKLTLTAAEVDAFPLPCCEAHRLATSSGSAGPAKDVYGPYVVGIDVSGDPTRGDISRFLPLLQ
jgi:hypothetical protein